MYHEPVTVNLAWYARHVRRSEMLFGLLAYRIPKNERTRLQTHAHRWLRSRGTYVNDDAILYFPLHLTTKQYIGNDKDLGKNVPSS